MKRGILSALLTGTMLGVCTGAQAIPHCDAGNTVKFAGLQWESGNFITEVMEMIFAKGYGCKVESVPGTSILLEHATATNDVQIFAEQWLGRDPTWPKALAEGKVVNIGSPFVGAIEGWFVPTYMVAGDAARGIKASAPELKKVSQLTDKAILKLFSDPEEPSKGRFLNCPSGWSCEGLNTARLTAYGLDPYYTNFRPGTGTALDAAIAAAYAQGQPVLFYYWSPTAVMGKYLLTKLEEPPYDEQCWKKLSDPLANHTVGCSFPTIQVVYGLNAEFAKAAPEFVEILSKATFPIAEVNEALAYMVDKKADAKAAAEHFLKTRKNIWNAWVSEQAKKKINDSLK